jgi:hypothetical protein
MKKSVAIDLALMYALNTHVCNLGWKILKKKKCPPYLENRFPYLSRRVELSINKKLIYLLSYLTTIVPNHSK